MNVLQNSYFLYLILCFIKSPLRFYCANWQLLLSCNFHWKVRKCHLNEGCQPLSQHYSKWKKSNEYDIEKFYRILVVWIAAYIFLRMNNRTIIVHSSNRCNWTILCFFMNESTREKQNDNMKEELQNGWKWISPFFNNQWFHQMLNNSFLFWYGVTQKLFQILMFNLTKFILVNVIFNIFFLNVSKQGIKSTDLMIKTANVSFLTSI